MAVAVCLPAPESLRELVYPLSGHEVDAELHIVEAWPGSVDVQLSAESGNPEWISGFVLDAVASNADGLSGFFVRIAPHEAPALRARADIRQPRINQHPRETENEQP